MKTLEEFREAMRSKESKAAALAKAIECALEDHDDAQDPKFVTIDVIEGEPNTLGVECSDGERFFVTVEPV